MAVPKKKHSKGRTQRRRGNKKLTVPNLIPCPHCKKLKESHRECPHCGKYN